MAFPRPDEEGDRMGCETERRPRVSVIMPVYNNEAYLRQTLDSLKQQTFPDFEALCVDDGSTDRSAGIIREYAAKDPRFHYIHQENSGAGCARNHGKRKARGEYIAFLDGDDLYAPTYLQRMTEALDATGADVGICERESFRSGDGQVFYRGRLYSAFEEGRAYPTQELAARFYELMTVFCWDKMFRHSFLQAHPYEFQTLHHCNDVCFVCSTMTAAQTVCFVKDCLVSYRVGSGTSTQDKVPKHPLCALEAFGQTRENVYRLHESDPVWQKSIDARCADAFFNTFQKVVMDEGACKAVYDAFQNQYELEWKLREKPLAYFEDKVLRLKMWSYRRASYETMREVFGKLHRERGKKRHLSDLALPYAQLVICSLLKR